MIRRVIIRKKDSIDRPEEPRTTYGSRRRNAKNDDKLMRYLPDYWKPET